MTVQVEKLQKENSQQDKQIQTLNTNTNTKLQTLSNKNANQESQIQNLDNENSQQENQIQNLGNKNSQQDAQIQSLIDKLKKIETELNGKPKQTIPPGHYQKSRTQLIFYFIRNFHITLNPLKLNLTLSVKVNYMTSCFKS